MFLMHLEIMAMEPIGHQPTQGKEKVKDPMCGGGRSQLWSSKHSQDATWTGVQDLGRGGASTFPLRETLLRRQVSTGHEWLRASNYTAMKI